MKTAIAATIVTWLLPAAVFAQDPGQIQRLFRAGRYQRVVEATTPDAPPDVLFTTAQSQQKLGATDQAMQTFSRLAERPEGDPWRFIGLSGRQLLGAISTPRSRQRARPWRWHPTFREPIFSLVIFARAQQWGEAAAAFDAASDRQPNNAYAHYYGGMMHYRANRIDRMAMRLSSSSSWRRKPRAARGAVDHEDASGAINWLSEEA